MNEAPWRLEPQYLQSVSGALFAHLTVSRRPVEPRESVLILPPLGEEMNKSRPMLALLARQLATKGFDALLPDLYGTGDSAGDFADAEWPVWREDIQLAWRFLAARTPARVHVLALRSGAMLASALRATTGAAHGKLVLWQPVIKGADFWRQMVRLRTAGQSLRGAALEGPTPQEVLARDGGIEIAGYRFSSSLVAALNELNLDAEAAAQFAETLWVDVAAAPQTGLTPATERTTREWHSKSVKVTTRTVNGEPFWTTAEIAMVPELCSMTAAHFAATNGTAS